ncbi:uncharacterized protein MYCGRDRAFT_102916 [Zymoseptoria tritici IPO323]|uniref:Uncharacterized protein n=1 Tax=Zymoseptoria tritici (strain CBS 115943 / IPO323) TaxID=336722 RepID=F9X0S0_ZYMTI|nr:uncharacterized protein MYCGRDRAFT_102916 [Zymoseptoria tritici IPO323]EGP91727.1 hypothetical protein MYCGRDRAFT_102916 [Zymoseptoria tritici IPO323]
MSKTCSCCLSSQPSALGEACVFGVFKAQSPDFGGSWRAPSSSDVTPCHPTRWTTQQGTQDDEPATRRPSRVMSPVQCAGTASSESRGICNGRDWSVCLE